jgi:hypothetical protein
MSPKDILMKIYDCSDENELQLYITLNPNLERIIEAMNEYAEAEIINFENWIQGPYCNYSLNDEDDWQHIVKRNEHITTRELYNIYKSEDTDKHNNATI